MIETQGRLGSETEWHEVMKEKRIQETFNSIASDEASAIATGWH
jgi:hypothetical protein